MRAFRRNATIALAASAALLVATAARGGPEPAGDVLIDRDAYGDDATAFQALQDAVDGGGTIVVEGTFSLAAADSLRVGRHGNDATIKASRAGGTPVGGTNTISQVGSVQMTLIGLRITRSRGSYVLIAATTGTTIRGCVMTDLSPDPGSVGVRVRNLTGPPADLLIANNAIDAGSAPWSFAAVNCGILVNRVRADLSVTIRGNLIEGGQTAGIFVNESTGAYLVRDNRIVVAGDPQKGPYLWAAGIWGRGFNGFGPASFAVIDNDIEAASSAFAIGYGNFLAVSPALIVSQNRVHLDEVRNCVFSALLLHGNVDASVWNRNAITGSTVNAIAMVVGGDGPAEGNLFDQNQIDVDLRAGEVHPFFGFAMPASHLYLGPGANDNLAKGFEGLTVVDEGEGNEVR